MLNVYLVRHGRPKPEEEDPERPLSEEGLKEVRRMAAYLASRSDVRVREILHSPKTRARETAEILAEKLKPAAGVNEAEGLKPLDEPSIWAARLVEGVEGVMLVGHLPHLSRLASLLLCSDEDREAVAFSTASVACLERDGSGLWSLRWLVTPDMLPTAGSKP